MQRTSIERNAIAEARAPLASLWTMGLVTQLLAERRTVRLDIQALRAVAVATVVVYHLAPAYLPGGFVGVDVFFVISGYLITSLLIERPPTAGSDLLDFWARRIRRLLPASLLVLVTSLTATWALLPETRWTTTAEHARASALYYVNWALQADAVDYLRAESTYSVFQHYWSLAIEEQFYILWPVLILLLARIARRHYEVGLGLVVAASFAYSIHLTGSNPAAAYFSTWTRIWELGAGGLVALAATSGRWPLRGWGGPVIAATGWTAIVTACFAINDRTPFPGWAATLPIVGTALVLMAGAEFGWHRWRPVHWLGGVSYSVYLWHWPLILILPVVLARGAGSAGRGALDNAAIVVTTLVLAGLTKRFVEDPFRTPQWAKRRRATYAHALAGMAIVVLLASALQIVDQRRTSSAERALQSALASEDPCRGAGSLDTDLGCPDPRGPLIPAPALAADDRSPVYKATLEGKDCSSDDEVEYPLLSCTFGDPNGRFNVALVGNSHAGQWASALIEIAKARRWHVTTYIAAGCATAETRPIWDNGAEAADECIRWNHELVDALRADTPDLVVMSNRTSNPAEGRQRLESSYDLWEAGYRTRLLELTSLKVPIALIRDTPAPENDGMDSPPDCIASRRDSADCSGPRASWIPVDPSADAARSLPGRGITIIDLNDYICTPRRCSVAVGGVIAYSDGSHLTATFNRTLTPYLDEAIQDALRPKGD